MTNKNVILTEKEFELYQSYRASMREASNPHDVKVFYNLALNVIEKAKARQNHRDERELQKN